MQFPELPPSCLPACVGKTRTAVTAVTQTAATVCQFPATLNTLPHSSLRATPYEEGITVIPVLQQKKNKSEMLTNWPVITQPARDRTQLEINSSSEPAILASISSDSQDKCVPKTNILLWPSQRRRAEGKDTWWKFPEVWRCRLRRC